MKLLAALLILCSGCAELLNTVSAGQDATLIMIKAGCPQRTQACDIALTSLNTSIVAYNGALLAKSIGEDEVPYAAKALAELKNAWAALKTLVQP
jgi:hypothetical protein